MAKISRCWQTAIFFCAPAMLMAADYNVKGTVCDSIGNPESFATLRIYQLPDSVHPKTSGVSEENGNFNIALPDSGEYRVNILSFGKQDYNKVITVSDGAPTADLGKISLSDMASELQEVTVTAQRPLVTKEIDRIGYDVQADSDSKTSQLDEILKKVPLVSVDPDGTIKVKGSTDFKIYKNGRPNNSFSRNAKDIFKALPASMIKKIEVITDPGAREDAEGTSAILNIVTMENTVVKGVMGSASLSYRSDQDIPSPSLWLSAQIDKVTLSGYGGYQKMPRHANRFRTESLTIYEDSGNEQYSESEGASYGQLGYFGIDGSIEPDTLNLITVEASGYIYNFDSESDSAIKMKDAAGNPVYSYSMYSIASPNRYFDINGGLNYQRSTRRKGESITMSYLLSSTNQKQHNISDYNDEWNMPVNYTGTSNEFTLDFIEHTGQIDWTRPINDANKFDVGAKYINRNNHSINDLDYFTVGTTHTDFTHNTQVMALYFDYRLKLKKFGARAGLRYEFSHLSAKYKDGTNEPFSSNLNDWVPNVAVSYNVNDANTLKLSYSTRINRPGISQLNPTVITSPHYISSGNPDLVSSHHQSINLNYNLIGKKLSMDLGASYSFVNNAVISVQELLPGDITRYTYANEGRNRWVNFALWINYTPWSKTSIMLNANANYAYRANNSLDIKTDGWGMDAYMRVRQQLPWDISLNVYGNIYKATPDLYSVEKFNLSSRLYYGLQLQKSFLKEKRLSVSAGISNPFGKNPLVFESTPRNNGTSGYSRSYNYSYANRFSISISYRFGSLNAQVKKTVASINNDDVENRKN